MAMYRVWTNFPNVLLIFNHISENTKYWLMTIELYPYQWNCLIKVPGKMNNDVKKSFRKVN